MFSKEKLMMIFIEMIALNYQSDVGIKLALDQTSYSKPNDEKWQQKHGAAFKTEQQAFQGTLWLRERGGHYDGGWI